MPRHPKIHAILCLTTLLLAIMHLATALQVHACFMVQLLCRWIKTKHYMITKSRSPNRKKTSVFSSTMTADELRPACRMLHPAIRRVQHKRQKDFPAQNCSTDRGKRFPHTNKIPDVLNFPPLVGIGIHDDVTQAAVALSRLRVAEIDQLTRLIANVLILPQGGWIFHNE